MIGDIDGPEIERKELARLFSDRYDLWHDFKQIYVDGQSLTYREVKMLRREVFAANVRSTQVLDMEGFEGRPGGTIISRDSGYFHQSQLNDENSEEGTKKEVESVIVGRSHEDVTLGKGLSELSHDALMQQILVQFAGHSLVPEQNLHGEILRGGTLKRREEESKEFGQEGRSKGESAVQRIGQTLISEPTIGQSTYAISSESEFPVQRVSILAPGFPHECSVESPFFNKNEVLGL